MPDPSPSNADSLNFNFLQLGRRSGGRPQRTVYPRQLPVNCDTHTRWFWVRLFATQRTQRPLNYTRCYRRPAACLYSCTVKCNAVFCF